MAYQVMSCQLITHPALFPLQVSPFELAVVTSPACGARAVYIRINFLNTSCLLSSQFFNHQNSKTMSTKNTRPVTTQENGPLNLLRPLLLLSYSAYYIVPTILSLILSFNFKTLLSIEDFKDAWFARFWAFFGPRSREAAAPSVMPLLENNARGVCLDIGPGTGQWLYLFQRANNPDITKIYGVEPNPGMHRALRENAVKAGLGEMAALSRSLHPSAQMLTMTERRHLRDHWLWSGRTLHQRRTPEGERRHHHHSAMPL